MAPRATASDKSSPATGSWPSPQDCVALHRSMATLRALDSRASNLSREGQAGLYLPCADTVGLLAAVACRLNPSDWVLPGVRQSLIAVARGLSLDAWLGQVLGRANDPSRGRQEPGHLAARSVRVGSAATPLGANLTHAVGVARAMKRARRREATVALAGQAVVATPDFHVALNFAAVWQVPVVFVITSGAGLEHHTASDGIAIKASAYGLSATTCQARDPLAVATTIEGALEQARDGGGPMLIEARLPPDASGQIHLVGRNGSLDVVDAFMTSLVERGLLDEVEARDTVQQVGAQVDEAATRVLALPPPPTSTLFDDVFARRTPGLSADRRLLLARPGGN